MDDAEFGSVERRLLRGGVAPRHVRLIVKELHHHHADLLEDARAQGMPEVAAARSARQRLGTDDRLVAEALARPELRSWAHRWPWAVYGLGPLIAYLLVAATVLGMIAVGFSVCEHYLTRAEVFAMVTVPSVRFVFEHFTWLIVYPLSLAAAAAFCLLAARRDSPIFWPLVGVLLVCVLGSGADVHFQYPDTPDGPGSIGAGLALSLSVLLQGMLTSVVVFGPYLAWRMRRH
jgi:hypothetical protein